MQFLKSRCICTDIYSGKYLRLIVKFGISEPPPDHIVELYHRRLQLGLPVGYWDGVEAALGMSIKLFHNSIKNLGYKIADDFDQVFEEMLTGSNNQFRN